MGKTLDGRLVDRVSAYVFDYLARPRQQLEGMPICPFIKTHRAKIDVVATEHWEIKIRQVCELIGNIRQEAVVICGSWIDYDEILSICDDYQSRYQDRDVEILLMHPDTEQSPLPLEYTFTECPLVIVQKQSTLENARKQLRKAGKYYKFYK